MSTVNGYTIQQKMKTVKSVSVPWIQVTFDLDYRDAKAFLQQLITRGWVEKTPQGIQYPVKTGNLRLRPILRSEVAGLIADIDSDCVTALSCIRKGGAMGATLREITSAVKGDDDTKDALAILIKRKLIYQHEEAYYATISEQAVDVLAELALMKRRHEMKTKMTGIIADQEEFTELFEVLFYDDEDD